MINANLPHRGKDDWGDGAFHASRGFYKGKPKKHKGIDYQCPVGAQIHAPVSGEFTKYGICYRTPTPGKPRYRYVEITDEHGAKWRFFYVRSHHKVGTVFHKGDHIGFCQDIAGKYSRPDKIMLNHLHAEILVKKSGRWVEVKPEDY